MSDRVLVYEPRHATSRVAIVRALRGAGLEVLDPADEVGLSAALRLGVSVALVQVGRRGGGVRAVRALQRADADVEVIGLAAAGDVSGAVAAVKAGASTVLERPADEGAIEAVLHALASRQRVARTGAASEVDGLLGVSPVIDELRAELVATARAPRASVLLHGEAGVGKTLAAELVHRMSPRRRGPLERLSALGATDREVDARLFGRAPRPVSGRLGEQGILTRAHRGAVLIQHVEHLGPRTQAKLTAFLDTGRVLPVGSRRAESADVRVLATTRADLVRHVAAGRFSAELYYRLTVHPLSLPPLRSRPEDVRHLVGAFVARANRRLGMQVGGIDQTAVERLRAHDWPGNVRALEHAVFEAVARSTGPTLTASDFSTLGRSPPPCEGFRLPEEGVDLDEVERRFVTEALVRTGGNRMQAARLLGLNRDQLRYRMLKYGLQYRRYRGTRARKRSGS